MVKDGLERAKVAARGKEDSRMLEGFKGKQIWEDRAFFCRGS